MSAKIRPRPIADGVTPADPEGGARPEARHLRHFTGKCRMVGHPGRRQYITVARCENVSRGGRSRNRHHFLLANGEVLYLGDAATRSRSAFLAPVRSSVRRWRSRTTRGSPRTPWDQSARRSSRSPSVHMVCAGKENPVCRTGRQLGPLQTRKKISGRCGDVKLFSVTFARKLEVMSRAIRRGHPKAEAGHEIKLRTYDALRLRHPIGSIRPPHSLASFTAPLHLLLAIQLTRLKIGSEPCSTRLSKASSRFDGGSNAAYWHVHE